MPARFFIADGPNLYGKYLNGAIPWAELSDFKDLKDIYHGGYLPYTGDTDSSQHLFYMSRSLRVSLKHFRLGKKRRYDHRIWKSHGLERRLTPSEEFRKAYGDEMLKLACKWMEPRFGGAAIDLNRLQYILSKPFLNGVLSWHRNGKLAAFAFIVWGEWGAHYWYVFYENGHSLKSAPGHGYLVDFLDWCNSVSLPFAFLGTAYGGKSGYKSRGIEGISFWDGSGWNENKAKLADLQKEDDRQFGSLPLSSP